MDLIILPDTLNHNTLQNIDLQRMPTLWRTWQIKNSM